jgi:hypothetical protein
MTNPKKFILSLYDKEGKFNYSPENKTKNLFSSCFGVMGLDVIGELKRFKKKKETIKFIRNHQEKRTGCFIDNSVSKQQDPRFDEKYLLLQLTDYSQLALSALGVRPKYRYQFLEKYKDEKYLIEWLELLDWSRPWLVSNLVMFILNSLIYENIFWKIKNDKFVDIIIDWLDHNQDSETGFWNLGAKSTQHNQMAGAYHFLFFYTYLKKEPNHIKKIIDSTLALQDYDGLFCFSGGGGSCSDLDAVDILCRATLYTNYRESDIEKALIRAHKSLTNNQNKDGGFCWAKRNRLILKKNIYSVNFNLIWRGGFDNFVLNMKSKLANQFKVVAKKPIQSSLSGVKEMSLELNKSDLFSTWFRLTTIAMIEETFPEIFNNQKTFDWKMRDMPGLGFYKKNQN